MQREGIFSKIHYHKITQSEHTLTAPIDPPPKLLSRLLTRMEVDRAVGYSVTFRAWQLAAGPVSLIMIALFFSPEEQGFYYAFANLMAMQAFLELGLNVVVLNLTSGQWAHLSLDDNGRITGDPDARARLGNLLRQLLRWYSMVSLLFVLGVGTVGYFFLLGRDHPGTDWLGPWWLLTLMTAGLTWTWPVVSILEGCNQVVKVNRYRVIQAVLGNIAVWAIMFSGGGLWAAPASAAVRVLCDLHLAAVRYRPLFASLLATARQPKLDWMRKVWPLQWRQGVIVAFQFFELYLLTLVIFEYHGPVAGGQTGMTWTLATTLHAGALAWVQTRAPRFGSLVAQEKFDQLNSLFRRVTLIAMGVAGVGLVIMSGFVYALDRFEVSIDVAGEAHRLADRVLPLPIVVLYLAIMALKVPPHCMAFYIRAHRREPLLPLSVASSTAAGLLVWLGGWQYGPLGAGVGLLTSTLLINLPGHYAIWRKFKREQQQVK